MSTSKVSLEDFKRKVENLGGFESIKFSPHMRFRAGQRRINWEAVKKTVESGDIDSVEVNQKPNRSIPFEEAYVIFISVEDEEYLVPFYILENGSMKSVTVMRK